MFNAVRNTSTWIASRFNREGISERLAADEEIEPLVRRNPSSARLGSSRNDIAFRGAAVTPGGRRLEVDPAPCLRDCMPNARVALKIHWINVVLASTRFRANVKGLYDRQQRDTQGHGLESRPDTLVDIQPMGLDEPYYDLITALRLTSDGANQADARTGQVTLDHVSRITFGEHFSRHVLGYSTSHWQARSQGALEVLRFHVRDVASPLNGQDLRTLHNALKILEGQKKDYRLHAQCSPRDVATVQVYHRLYEALVENGDALAVADFLNTVDDYLVFMKSRPTPPAFDQLSQYHLVLNTLFQDLNQRQLITAERDS